MRQAISEIEGSGYLTIQEFKDRNGLGLHISQLADALGIELTHLQVKRLNPNAKLPTKAHDNDAGYDLYSTEDVILKSGSISTVSTGIALAIPDGYVGLIWDRSSMGSKGIKVFGGVIDAGYRGEVKLKLGALDTLNRDWISVPAGSKVAQIIIQKVENFPIVEVDELPDSTRGEKGFGSSGK